MGDMFGGTQPDFDRDGTVNTTGFEGTKLDVKGYNPQGIIEPNEDDKDDVQKIQEISALLEKNTPTSPDKWAKAKAAAKSKFKVYPSAYANLWAAKKYKSMGGGWKKGKK